MSMLMLIGLIVVLLFGCVVFVGAPYLPTLKMQQQTALELLALKKGELLLELGCGDGRVIRAAASQGVRCVGYELNPILAFIAYISTYKYRKNVQIIWGNYWNKEWPPADAVYVFLLDKYMKKLDKKVIQTRHNIRLVSIAFMIPGRQPKRVRDGVFLYQYKATKR
jgi:hypothetical protein